MNAMERKIIERAKKTKYNHHKWFKEGRTVYEAMEYFARCPDFVLDVVSSVTSEDVEGVRHRGEAVDILVKKGLYSKLVLRYNGRERGTDRGKLKLQTYIILKRGGLGLAKVEKQYSVELSSCGNIDHDENPYEQFEGAAPSIYKANTIEKLQEAVTEYIEKHNLGGGNYNGGKVRDAKGKELGYISYNGRYWEK